MISEKISLSSAYYNSTKFVKMDIIELLASYSIFTTVSVVFFSVLFYLIVIKMLLKNRSFNQMFVNTYKTINELNSIYIFVIGFVPLFIKMFSMNKSLDFFYKIDGTIILFFIGMVPMYISILFLKIFSEIYEKVNFN